MNSVCIILSSDGTPHMVVKNPKDAKKYCEENNIYTWEEYMVMGV